MVRTGCRAGTASDALKFIDQHQPALVEVLDVCFRRSDLHAGRIGTVVAGVGHVVGEHILLPRAFFRAFPCAARILGYAPKLDPGSEPCLSLQATTQVLQPVHLAASMKCPFSLVIQVGGAPWLFRQQSF